MTRLVIIESPYRGKDANATEGNVRYARRAMRDSLLRGEYPLASHLLYTQPGILDDGDPAERKLGIDAGLAWGAKATATVVYADRGITEGMGLGIAAAEMFQRPVEYRYIGRESDIVSRKSSSVSPATP